MNKKNKKSKKIGQIFTPQNVVDDMLDYIGYYGPNILSKHIIDNSCGDGAFLKSIVIRYCKESIKQNRSICQIKNDLERYIHGIDIDINAYNKCIDSLNNIANSFGIYGVEFDILNENSVCVKKYDGIMDFVIGNPPYIRIHNLDDYKSIKSFSFSNGGMIDIYLIFFEIGFNMLNERGKLCYITPSSWTNSRAADNMRKYILNKKNLVKIIDFCHFQVFDNATTYTMISLFDKSKHDGLFDFYSFDEETHTTKFVDALHINDCYINSCFYFSDKNNLKEINKIKTATVEKIVSVKNGFATLADDVFIGDCVPESNITINVLKASTGKWYKCLYPYDQNGKLIPKEIIFSDASISDYLEKNKNKILKGKPEYPTYYEFGRSQALNDVHKRKIAINSIIKTENDLRIENVDSGCGVYSGFYLTSEYNIYIDDINDVLKTTRFINYVKLLRKYKSGGYYTFSSNDVQQYINYCLTYNSNNKYHKLGYKKSFSLI